MVVMVATGVDLSQFAIPASVYRMWVKLDFSKAFRDLGQAGKESRDR
jgi:hypothetical protein